MVLSISLAILVHGHVEDQCKQFSMAQWARTAYLKRSGESGALMM